MARPSLARRAAVTRRGRPRPPPLSPVVRRWGCGRSGGGMAAPFGGAWYSCLAPPPPHTLHADTRHGEGMVTTPHSMVLDGEGRGMWAGKGWRRHWPPAVGVGSGGRYRRCTAVDPVHTASSPRSAGTAGPPCPLGRTRRARWYGCVHGGARGGRRVLRTPGSRRVALLFRGGGEKGWRAGESAGGASTACDSCSGGNVGGDHASTPPSPGGTGGGATRRGGGEQGRSAGRLGDKKKRKTPTKRCRQDKDRAWAAAGNRIHTQQPRDKSE